MATTQVFESTAERIIRRIDSVLCTHRELGAYRAELEISVEESRIVLRGHLPSEVLKQALLPVIRQAGVLGQVCNCVEVCNAATV